jgi:hypothetical protein
MSLASEPGEVVCVAASRQAGATIRQRRKAKSCHIFMLSFDFLEM